MQDLQSCKSRKKTKIEMRTKKLVTIYLILASMFGTMEAQTPVQTSQTDSPNAMSFIIQGNIQGLMPGDTLRFEQLSMLGRKLDFVFDIIVTTPDEFTYSGLHNNIGHYMMFYKPVSGKDVSYDRRGITMLIKDGTTHLIGTADQIYYCQLKGGHYDNEALQEIMQLDKSLNIERGNFLRLSREARAANDTVKAKAYTDKFNSFYFDNQENYQKLSQLNNDFFEKYPSSEHTIINALYSVNSAPIEVSLSKYEKMNSDAQNSYFGKILKQEIDKINILQPGNDAHDFHLTAIDGQEISLADCAGSYLLIYHWGMCPGSFQIENEVTNFYNKYKDKLIIVGITESIETIKNLNDKTQPEDKLLNIEMKPVLESMLAHPWFEAEKTGNNGKIETDYAFAGLPYFVFISPEGKIISRGFREAFRTVKNTIESEFGK